MRYVTGVLALVLSIMALACSPAVAGKNAGGALVVHTDDAHAWTTGVCDHFDEWVPQACDSLNTRTDNDESTPALIWFIAAFPDTSDPGVTVVYFGIDHNLPQWYVEQHGYCGPGGTIEVPDAGWPDDTDAGNSVAFGSAVTSDSPFPFYYFSAYGFEDAYLGTAENPVGGYASFVDDSSPPVQDEVTDFGTVRWYAAGSNSCPSGVIDGGGEGGEQGGEQGDEEEEADQDPGGEEEANHWLDGDGERHWVRNRILVQLRSDLPIPPRHPAARLGIQSFDALGAELGMVTVRRVARIKDAACARFPVGSRLAQIRLGPGADEEDAAQRFAELTEVVWSTPDYAFPIELFEERTNLQWYLLTSEWESCLPDSLDSCCEDCDIGIDSAWAYSRGSSSVNVAFFDVGADMQHPDLFDVWARNPDPRESDGDEWVELCSAADSLGDINEDDADSNNVVDDVLLGYRIEDADSVSWKHHAEAHGTGVAGLLGAITNNGTGVASVAGGDSPYVPGVRLMQFSRPGGAGQYVPVSVIQGTFIYARTYGARVYSTSASISDQDSILHVAVGSLADSMLFVAAAGNSDRTPLTNPFARIPGVMAVGGYECQYGGRWSEGLFLGSDYGRELSVLGPANYWEESEEPQMVMASIGPSTPDSSKYLCTPQSPDSVQCFGGTSAATPIVASIAALLFSYSDEQALGLTPAQVRKIIERTAEDVLCDAALSEDCDCDNPETYCADSLLGWDRFTGYGRVDAGRAFTLPVAALDPLEPYADFVIYRGRVRFSWEKIQLPSNTSTPDHLRLDYYVPEEYEEGWQVIADSIPWTENEYTWTADSLLVGDHRYFRLAVMDSEKRMLNADYRRFRFQWTTDVATEQDSVSMIYGVWPNPSAGGARVKYVLPAPAEVRVEVFDVAGRHVRTVTEGMQAPGTMTVDWDGLDDRGRHVASGMYFIRLALGSHVRTVRLIRIR